MDAEVVVVGSGFSGIALVVALRRAGIHDVVVLERADDVGGTWRDNTYPGCACDIPSHLYSLSYAPNPDWSRLFSPQAEIEDYLRRCATDLGVRPRLRLGTSLESAAWDPAGQRWEVRTSAGDYRARVLVLATGALSEPRRPDIPGLDDFGGPVVHTAAWPAGLDLAGRRVAVIGTGASAIQVVPALAPVASHLDVFQRTPAWILPRRDRPTTAREREVFRRHPMAQRMIRAGQYWRRELTTSAFTTAPWLMSMAEKQALAHLARQVPDPELRRLLTPGYRMGCKRVLLSDDFYPAFARPDVRLVPGAAVRVLPDAVVGADGVPRPADAIVLATGFEVTHPPIAARVEDGAGRTLARRIGEHPVAYRGCAFAGFPNLFLMTGPNTGLGNNSMVVMIEAQAAYVADALRVMRRDHLASVEVRSEALADWDDRIARASAHTVWTAGGCHSWYLDERGRNVALWPWGTRRFVRETRHFDPAAYLLRAEVVAPAGDGPRATAGSALERGHAGHRIREDGR